MTRPLALVLAAALLLVSQAAIAKPKVALTEIEGDTSGDVRDAVAEALEGNELSLIGSKEVNRAVDKLGDLADLTEKDFKKLANELEADAIVLGKLDKAGGAKTLKFRLFVRKKMAKGFTVSFKDAKSEKFRALLHDKMVDKLGMTASTDDEDRPARPRKTADDEDRPARPRKAADDEDRPARPRKTADDEDRPARPRKAADDDEPLARKDRKTAKRARDDDGAADDDDAAPRRSKKKVATSDDADEVESGISARAAAGRPANRVALRADAGVSMVQRSFKFNANDFDQRPKDLTLSPVPGVRFEAEAYPLALSRPDSPVAGLGFAIEYDKTLSLSLTTANAMGTFNAPVKQMHYSLGVRYRVALGKTETSPTLTVGAGFSRRLFSVDLANVTDPQASSELRRDTPSTEYTAIDPGLAFRFPVTRMVAFVAGGRGLIITRTGPIQNGSSYGRAKVYGAEGMAALDVVLGTRFALRFSGEFVQIGYAFEGVGALSNGLDGDPSQPDVGGLADRSIGGAATLAVMY
jgi:hypothetical protein